jgi:L-serine dehydratase
MSFSVFDSLGPIMIGPSSSHTAGAAKIGLVANKIAENNIKSVIFYLHGSFGKTYKGHGSDKALLGGVIGMNEKDINIRNAFQIATEKGITYEFIPKDLGEVHPNTVLIEITTKENSTLSIQGSSIGGGRIMINQLNGLNVNFSGGNPTLITNHKDIPGIVSKVTAILAKKKLNISTMSVIREEDSADANMIIELDDVFDYSIRDELLNNVVGINKIYMF